MTATQIAVIVFAECCVPTAADDMTSDEAKATIASLFKALGDPHRVRIVNLLATAREAVCVCDLTDFLGLSQPTVSHHMRKLVDAGLLAREQRGVWAYYSSPRRDPTARRGAALRGRNGTMSDVRDEVRERYAAAAKVVATGRAADDNGPTSRAAPTDALPRTVSSLLYDVTTRADLPEDAVLASMGCGTRPWSPSFVRVRPCWTWGPAAASTCCCRPSASARPARRTAST